MRGLFCYFIVKLIARRYMNKFFPLILIPMFMLACGDDKSSSAADEVSSSSEETIFSSSEEEIESSSEGNAVSSSSENKAESTSSSSEAEESSEAKDKSSSSKEIISEDGWITIEKIDHFSFFDEEHLRYYFLEEECDYDSTTNTFKWVTEDYTGVFNRYDRSILEDEFNGDSLKYMIWYSFGYKMSNDTLYECDYIGDACDTIKTATVYIGSSKSIFSTWECVGRIYHGEYSEIPDSYKITLTLTPKQSTTRTSYLTKTSTYPTEYCRLIYDLFKDEEKEKLCEDYFRNIDQITADTAFISNDIWLVAKDSNIVYVSVNNQIFETDISQTLDMRPSQYSLSTQKVTYQGITCTYWNKNVDITQQYCEEGNPDLDLVRNDYSNIHHKDVPMLRGYSENSNEFEECIKQFNLN